MPLDTSGTTHKEDLSVKCDNFSFNKGIIELEDIEVKALLLSIVDKIGTIDTLNYITDSEENDLSEIVEFIDDNYGMENAVDCLDDERTQEIKDHLNA